MKRVHLLLVFILTNILSLFLVGPTSAQSSGTEVGGIISSDTTWTLASSPYYLVSEVQIDKNITLTIEPGVIIYGNGNSLQTWGILSAIGTSENPIKFYNINLEPGDRNTSEYEFVVELRFVITYSSYLFNEPAGYGGSLILSDSEIWSPRGTIMMVFPDADCYLERNSFYLTGQDSNLFIVTILQNGINAYVSNNLFLDITKPEPEDKLITNIYAVDDSEFYVEYNSFLCDDRIAVSFIPGGSSAYSPSMVAINNYWNTTDVTTIESMIHDHNDDLAIIGTIEYLPILFEPHTDTPGYKLNQIFVPLIIH